VQEGRFAVMYDLQLMKSGKKRAVAHKLLLADPAQAADLMEESIAQVFRYLDRISAPLALDYRLVTCTNRSAYRTCYAASTDKPGPSTFCQTQSTSNRGNAARGS
jgi:hypothetical protein